MKLPCHFFAGFAVTLTAILSVTVLSAPNLTATLSSCSYGSACDAGFYCTAIDRAHSGVCAPYPHNTHIPAAEDYYNVIQVFSNGIGCWSSPECYRAGGNLGSWICDAYVPTAGGRVRGSCFFLQESKCTPSSIKGCPEGYACSIPNGLCVEANKVVNPPTPTPTEPPVPVPPPTNQPIGASCTSDNECTSGYCRAGSCATDNRCTSTDDCEAKDGLEGTICIGAAANKKGSCVASCTKTGIYSCPEGKFCSQLTRLCGAQGTKKGGESCRENEECASNYCAGGITCNPGTDDQEEKRLNDAVIAAQANYDSAVEARDAAKETVDEAKSAYDEAKSTKNEAKQAYADAKADYKAANPEDKADALAEMNAAKADYQEATTATAEAKREYASAKAAYAGAKRTVKTQATALKAAKKAYKDATK